MCFLSKTSLSTLLAVIGSSQIQTAECSEPQLCQTISRQRVMWVSHIHVCTIMYYQPAADLEVILDLYHGIFFLLLRNNLTSRNLFKTKTKHNMVDPSFSLEICFILHHQKLDHDSVHFIISPSVYKIFTVQLDWFYFTWTLRHCNFIWFLIWVIKQKTNRNQI